MGIPISAVSNGFSDAGLERPPCHRCHCPRWWPAPTRSSCARRVSGRLASGGLPGMDAHEERGRDLAIGVAGGRELGHPSFRFGQCGPGRPSARDHRVPPAIDRSRFGHRVVRTAQARSRTLGGTRPSGATCGGPRRASTWRVQSGRAPARWRRSGRLFGGFDGRRFLALRGQDERASAEHFPDRRADPSSAGSTLDWIEEEPRFVRPPQSEECLSLVGHDHLPADRDQQRAPGFSHDPVQPLVGTTPVTEPAETASPNARCAEARKPGYAEALMTGSTSAGGAGPFGVRHAPGHAGAAERRGDPGRRRLRRSGADPYGPPRRSGPHRSHKPASTSTPARTTRSRGRLCQSPIERGISISFSVRWRASSTSPTLARMPRIAGPGVR